MNNSAGMREPHQKFIVLTSQRTGSSWFLDSLNSLPGVQGHMELFYHDIRREPPRGGCNNLDRFVEIGSRFYRGVRPFAVFAYLNALYRRPACVGFKLMYSQLRHYPEILAYLIVHRLKVIHLVRDNPLDVLISEATAVATGHSHATREEGRGQSVKVNLDVETLPARINRLQRKQSLIRQLLRLLPNPILEVHYESLCRDSHEFERAARFIGASGLAPESKLLKRQQSAHADIIANYGQLQRALADTELMRYLE